MASLRWVTAAVNELSILNGFDLLFLSEKRKENITYKQLTDQHPHMTHRCIMGKTCLGLLGEAAMSETL